MWILTVISIVGVVMFFSFSCVIVVSYSEVAKWLRLGIAWTSLFVLFAMIWLLTLTENVTEAYREMKKKEPKYELIQEPVYRKIK